MKKQKTHYSFGTVSSATMCPEDLIPAFAYELRHNVPLQRKHKAELTAIERRMNKNGYYQSEDADYDLEWLFETLDTYAAPYFYFGAHPGDGADYGFWLSEDFEDFFDGLKVSDLSEVPAGYRGEILLVNDHGNVSLYSRSARKLTEVWSVVQ